MSRCDNVNVAADFECVEGRKKRKIYNVNGRRFGPIELESNFRHHHLIKSSIDVVVVVVRQRTCHLCSGQCSAMIVADGQSIHFNTFPLPFIWLNLSSISCSLMIKIK